MAPILAEIFVAGPAISVTDAMMESPAVVGSPDWTLMAYDLASTYHNPTETTITKENAASLEILWRSDMGDNVYGAPLQVGDTIYASTGRVVRAFEAATGEELWRNTRAGTTGSLAYENGVLFAHRANSQVVALDANSGDQQWASSAGPTRGDGSSSPIVAGDLVFVGGSNGTSEVAGVGGPFRGWISGLDKATGEAMFEFFTVPQGAAGASLWSTVAVDLMADVVYGGTGNNHGGMVTDTSDAILAVGIAEQQLKWKNQRTTGDNWGIGSNAPDADFGANPVLYTTMVDGVATPMVAAGQKSGAVHGLKRADGAEVWTRSLCSGTRDGSGGIFTNGAWSGKHMLFACNGETTKLFGVDGASGEVLFEKPLPGRVWGRISTIPGVGFVGAGKELVIFDSDTGEQLKSVSGEGGSVTGTITVAHGRVAYGEGMGWSSAAPGSTLTVLAL